jgi:hypothetical protein
VTATEQHRRGHSALMEQAALRNMEAIGVQVLVIDEAHNILPIASSLLP